MKKRVIAGSLIILVGVLIVAYPWLRAAYFEYRKNMVLDQWEQAVAAGQMEKPQSTPVPLPTAPEPESNPLPSPPDLQLVDDVWEEDTNVPFDSAYVLENMEGILTIDKINLNYPILRGATKYHLDLTICSVAGSPEIGKEGNYCLAGHRSRIYGRQFNRLTELRDRDIVSLNDGVNRYDYAVVQTMLVSPEDTWVLDDVAGQRILTLITCDYTTKPTGRFIVKCEPVAVYPN